ncbi:MAG: hypothetical protein JST01_12710 [Cyanobacteria bacterium SZAS TMP-1]|nr:hypothetical protein [Cyanobacteria bacterium SZAS TMP-1]
MSSTDTSGDHPLRPNAPEHTTDSTLQIWAQNNVYSDTSRNGGATGTHKGDLNPHSAKSPAESDVAKILGDFKLSDNGPAARVAGDAGKEAAKAVIDQLKNQSQTSPDAAMVAVANTLADDARLTGFLTDSNGFITQKAVGNLHMADQGSVEHQRDTRNPQSTILTDAERKELDFILKHSGALGGGIVAGALVGASTGEIEKIAAKHPGASVSELTAIAAKSVMATIEAAQKIEKPVIRKADEPTVPPEKFAEVAKRVLAKIDTGHTGAVTKEQLAKAMEDPQFKGAEAQALAAMYKNFDKLHNLSGHEWMWSTDTITTGDLDKFAAIQKDHAPKAQESANLSYWAGSNLKNFTSNGSEYLTRDDIERGLKNPSTSQYDRQMLQLAKKYYGEMDSMLNFSGLKVKDFQDLAKKYDQDSDGKLISAVYSSCWMVSENAQKGGTASSLYGDADPLKSINAEAVKQGTIGDCYYEAVVAGLAKSNPAAIRDMIKDNHNGTYTVTFPGAPNEHITIKKPTEAELGTYNLGGKDGIWASVLEKAYGEYRRIHGHGAPTPQEGADGGGRPEPVVKLLTGKDADTTNVEGTKAAEIAKKLTDAFAGKPPKVVAAGINADGNFWHNLFGNLDPKTADQYYRQHEYTIVGFTPDGHGGGTVEVRNPWGGAAGTPDGTFKIPLNVFMRNFSDVTIQK